MPPMSLKILFTETVASTCLKQSPDVSGQLFQHSSRITLILNLYRQRDGRSESMQPVLIFIASKQLTHLNSGFLIY